MPEETQQKPVRESPETVIIDGKPVNVPFEVWEKGRAAVHEWHTNLEAPLAQNALKASGLTIDKVIPTGHGKRIVVGDVERAILADKALKAKQSVDQAPVTAAAGQEK